MKMIKKIMIPFVCSVLCLTLLAGCGSGASGENVQISHVYDSLVTFYTKCPYCGHLSYEQAEITKGESYSDSTFCENCGKVFSYSVKR